MLTGFPGILGAWQPGIYPVAPSRMSNSGFTVNTQDRNDVVAFWHAVYQASEGYQQRVGWTGNYTGTPGTTSRAFINDVERRLNYFRAMCGVPANVRLNTDSTVVIDSEDPFRPAANTLKSAAAQQSALMLIRNYNPSTGTDPAITHNPLPSLVGWSPAAWNASAKGNFAFGLYGPGAITEYMVEALSTGSATSFWNTEVGHRRWCLYPLATDYATGDQPGSSGSRPPSNVLYVVPRADELLSNVVPTFVSYPSAGFFPAPINSPYWSLSRADADFSSATVKMTTEDGTPVPISNIKRSTGYGDPAIVWQVSGDAATRSIYSDTTYKIRVTGIAGEDIPTSHEYSVTLINPDRLTTSLLIVGPTKLAASKATTYSLNPPAAAESIQVTAYKRNPAPWKENAEKSTRPQIIDDTGSNYDLMVTTSSFAGFGTVSGFKAFHLTFPTSYDLIARGVPDQSFEIDRDIVPNSKAKIKFSYRRGFMTTTSYLVVETSSNDGVTWKSLGQPIRGLTNTAMSYNVTQASLSLPKSITPIRIRFRYYTTGGAIYTHEASPKSPTGIFIDDISTIGCEWLEQKKSNALPPTANQFVFSSSSAGAPLVKNSRWALRLRTKLGGKWFNGPVTPVTVTGP